MSDQPENRKIAAVTLAAIIIAQAYAVAGVVPGLTEERPRHKGGRRRKKTWLEKQQMRRGWRE